MTFPLLVAQGDPVEIGASYGEQARALIEGNVEDYRARFRAVDLGTTEVRRLGEAFRTATHEHTPRIAATLDAVAEGCGVAVGDIYAINARTELMLPAGMTATECTSVAVTPEMTVSGHTLLAQNWDWFPSQRPYTLVLATRDERGHEIVCLTEAGMLAKTGLNSTGVGVCVNLLHCDRDGVPGGVPYHVLIRAALDQPHGISPALKVTSLPRSASINLLIGAAGGVAVDLEIAPGATGRLLPTDGLLTHANHFVSDIDVRDAIYDIGGSSLFRDYRLRQLLASSAADQAVSTSDVAAALRDHLGFPYAICRHVNHEDAAELQSLTCSSVVMDLDEQVMLVSDGPPCGSAFREISLGTVFDSQSSAA
ncbi:MAG: C45 family autoproteolytic acyltransferase/hydrolase [Nocardioidaceae bacterium]